MKKYQRLYCKNCKLIYGKNSFDPFCSSCKKGLVLKDFNPTLKVLLGVLIIVLASLTFLIPNVLIIWIGGFIWGGYIIYRGTEQWNKIEQLDGKQNGSFDKPHLKSDEYNEVITCGKCSEKFKVNKTHSAQRVTCPLCSSSYNIYA